MTSIRKLILDLLHLQKLKGTKLTFSGMLVYIPEQFKDTKIKLEHIKKVLKNLVSEGIVSNDSDWYSKK